MVNKHSALSIIKVLFTGASAVSTIYYFHTFFCCRLGRSIYLTHYCCHTLTLPQTTVGVEFLVLLVFCILFWVAGLSSSALCESTALSYSSKQEGVTEDATVVFKARLKVTFYFKTTLTRPYYNYVNTPLPL